MQLHLTIEEFEILKCLVEDEKRLCCDAAPSLPQLSAQPSLEDKWDVGCDFGGKGLSRNLQLGFDELEHLADALAWRKRRLTEKICSLAEPAAKETLERQLFILEHFLEKVTEACAML
jgi:hypothetical protein